jgi:choline dehydrogenase-like flavoprotein
MSTPPSGDVAIDTDVCIIGAGPAGISLARELIGHDIRVCLLEGGGRNPERDPGPVAHGEVVGLSYDQLDLTRLRGFGGNSSRWFLPVPGGHGLRLRALDPIDFERRDGMPYSGWPFDRCHMDPYYERAHRVFRLDDLDEEAVRSRHPERPALLLDDTRVVSPVFRFALGKWFTHEDRLALDNSPNVTTVLHANVDQLELDDRSDAVDTVMVTPEPGIGCLVNAPGHRGDHPLAVPEGGFRVRAKIFILAAGGSGNARLLLASNRQRERGLGNQHDLVGRFFMEHLHLWPGRLIPSDPLLFKRTGLYEPHVIDGVQHMAKLALADPVLRQEGLLNYCAGLHPDAWSEGERSMAQIVSGLKARRRPEQLGRHLGNIARDRASVAHSVGRKLRRAARRSPAGPERDPSVYLLATMSEQAPNPTSRIRLSEQRDELGRPRVALDWRLSELDHRTVDRAHEILDAELRRAGLGRLAIDRPLRDTHEDEIHGGWHHMGTTRMHPDARKGVVDQHGRVHGISNLYVAGSSVFPTSGYANPALTVMALALRLADRVATEMHASVTVH